MGKWGIVIAGVVTGLLGVALVLMGNPPNMGICVICFLRDTAGALGFHRATTVQYLRPEILGFMLGSFGSALSSKEFKARGGSSPALRFFIGAGVSISALVFLGCPLRMVLRLSAGDLNALVGIGGFVAGVFLGVLFLRSGYTLGRSHKLPTTSGYTGPALALVLLLFAVARPGFIFYSDKGPGSLHTPLVVSLLAGLIIGVLAQRTRLCMMGGVRDVILIRDFHLISGFVSIFLVALLANLAFGKFNLNFANQPIAHSDALYNFIGMAGAGLGSVMLGGCPLRQLIMAGEGDQDSVLTVLGLIAGAAIAHNFGLAASPTGVPAAGKVAAWIVLGGLVTVAWFCRETVSVGLNINLHHREASTR